jgi:hypothetical protein
MYNDTTVSHVYREIHGARRNTQLDGNECSANAWHELVRTVLLNDAIERGDYKNEEVGKLFAAPPSLIGEGDGGGDGEKSKVL